MSNVSGDVTRRRCCMAAAVELVGGSSVTWRQSGVPRGSLHPALGPQRRRAGDRRAGPGYGASQPVGGGCGGLVGRLVAPPHPVRYPRTSAASAPAPAAATVVGFLGTIVGRDVIPVPATGCVCVHCAGLCGRCLYTCASLCRRRCMADGSRRSGPARRDIVRHITSWPRADAVASSLPYRVSEAHRRR